MLVTCQSTFDRTQVGGFPGTELGRGTGAVDAHAPAGAFDGSTGKRLDGMIAGKGLPVVGGELPGPVRRDAGTLAYAVIILEIGGRQLIGRRVGTGEAGVGAESEGRTELELAERVDLQVDIALDADTLSLAFLKGLGL